MEFVLLKIGSPEWERIWNWLENHPLNRGLEQPSIALNENEGWQYVGSYRLKDKLISDFRHRKHPLTGKLETLSIAAEEVIGDEQIEKKYRM